MADETDNLVLEHLRAIRGEMSNLKEEVRGLRSETTALRHEIRATTVLVEQCVEEIATVRVRLDRIERRLELTEAAK